MKFTKHWDREDLWCCISGSYKGVRYSWSWDLDVQIVISGSLSSGSLPWFSSYLTNQKQPKPFERMNYPKLFALLSGFHKVTSWDRYCSLCISTSYQLLLNTPRYIIVCWRYFPLMLRKRSSTAGEQVECRSLQTNNTAKREQNYIEPSKTKSTLIGSNRKLS